MPLFRQSNPEKAIVPTILSPFPDVCLLNATDFASIQALQSAAKSSLHPNLILVGIEDLEFVLSWLEEKDDVCLLGSPDSMISHRLRQLSRVRSRRLDPLTHLLSRQPFDNVLSERAIQASPENPISVALCDVDHFKRINDQYGHSVGDEAICAVASLLKQKLDLSPAIGRLGGASFGAVLLSNGADSLDLAREIRGEVPNLQFESDCQLTVSLGIASAERLIDGAELMQRAEQALYTAKASGRDCVVSFDEMVATSRASGHDVDVIGLENQARVLAERVANVITLRSRRLLSTARKEADIDGLTGCFNRRYLDRRLEAEFNSRKDDPLTVAFIDLDHFGQVNKRFGWPSGDKILVEVCETIRNIIRKTDWLGRYGGEEFCLVMPGTKLMAGLIALKRIRATISEHRFLSLCDQAVPMTVSIGSATATTADSDYLELLDRASKMALFAKQNGRNQIQLDELE